MSVQKAFLKTEGFCAGSEPRFQIVPKLFEGGVFAFAASCFAGTSSAFLSVSCAGNRLPSCCPATGKAVVFAFSAFFGSFQKAFFRVGVNITVIFFVADMMTVKPDLFARSFDDALQRLDDFPVVFACQRRGLVQFEYAVVKNSGKSSVLLRLIEKASSAIPLSSYLTM